MVTFQGRSLAEKFKKKFECLEITLKKVKKAFIRHSIKICFFFINKIYIVYINIEQCTKKCNQLLSARVKRVQRKKIHCCHKQMTIFHFGQQNHKYFLDFRRIRHAEMLYRKNHKIRFFFKILIYCSKIAESSDFLNFPNAH